MFTILLNELEYWQAYRIMQGSTINVFFLLPKTLMLCLDRQPTHLFKWDRSGL